MLVRLQLHVASVVLAQLLDERLLQSALSRGSR
jgi:hypothetical protein